MSKIVLSVIIPAYNEAKNANPARLDDVYKYLNDRYPGEFELIFVDDGSSDGTLNILKQFAHNKKAVTVINNPHMGKGPTVRTGMLRATGKHRLFTDFDQSTPISEVEKLLPFRKKGYDIIVGSREVKGSKREREPWYRHIMGWGFNLVVQLLTVRGIRDTQCGFKLFSGKATEDLFPKLKVCVRDQTISHPFTGAFDVELLFLASKHDYLIAEVPVFWTHNHTERVSPVKDSLRMFMEVIRIRIADLTGAYAR